MAAVPTTFRRRLPDVTQRAETCTFDPAVTDRNVLTTTSGGRNGAEQDSRRALAAQMAAAATGFPWGVRRDAGPAGCDARGQARTVVALWLIGQAEEPLPATSTRTSVRTDGGDISNREVPASDLGAVSYGQAELAYAHRLMARPEARERVWANWAALTDPATTIDQARPLLRLDHTAASRTAEGTPVRLINPVRLMGLAGVLLGPLARAIDWKPVLVTAVLSLGMAAAAMPGAVVEPGSAAVTLRMAGVLLGAAAGFALVDVAAVATTVSPVPRWLRQWIRTLLVMGAAAAAWAVTFLLLAARMGGGTQMRTPGLADRRACAAAGPRRRAPGSPHLTVAGRSRTGHGVIFINHRAPSGAE